MSLPWISHRCDGRPYGDALTHDVLYETYRTEKLSRTVHADSHDSSILPEDLASQSVRLKEEQLRREEEKVSREKVRGGLVYLHFS